jgi:two-component system phosphate regulon response regulator OmpR
MTSGFHLLIIDDDERIRVLLQKFLIKNGYLVSVARDAGHARRILAGLDFDLIIMDVMMPGEDGVSLTKHLREKRNTPILLLTAKGETVDRIRGLEAGADDYLAKPFEPKELLLRLAAILRRAPALEQNAEKRILLTATESHLMRIFSNNSSAPLSRATLVEQLGRGGGQAQERAVDVQIARLRRKIETNPKQPRYLQTVRGAGYMLSLE